MHVLEHLRTQFSFHAAAHGLGWRVVPSSLSVRSDPRLLEQMIRNLLSNAVKYTNEGKILLGCRRRGDKLRIEVWDTGIGIPEEPTSSDFRGVPSARQSGARAQPRASVSVSRSSSAWQTCWATPSMSDPVRARARSLPSRCRSDRMRRIGDRASLARGNGTPDIRAATILVVEDDPSVREMLALLLDGEGHRTTTAEDGTKGAGIGGARRDTPGPRRRRLQSAERSERPAGRRRPARDARSRDPGHHPDRRHLDRHVARDRRRGATYT